MAGTPAPGQVFSIQGPQYGGSGYRSGGYEAPSPISAAFLDTSEAGGEPGRESASRKMKDVLTYAEYLDSQERSDWERQHRERQEQYAIEKDKREQRRLDMALEREKRASDLAFRNEELEHKAGSVIHQLYSLDPNRPDYRDKKKEILTSGDNYGVLNSKYGNQIVSAMKDLDAQHNNMLEWWRAQSDESGHQGSFYEAPLTKDGNIDFKASQELFNKAAQQKAIDLQSAQREQEYQMGQQGMVLKRSTYDPKTGQMTKQDYVPKTETGFKELKAAEREVDTDFKRNFGAIPASVLNYPVGTKDPRGYTITRGRMDGKKFVEDPGGNVVNVHSAQHQKSDVKIGLDEFNAFKDKYSKLSDARERIMQEYPALAQEMQKEAGQQKSSTPTPESAQPESAQEGLRKKRESEASSKENQKKIADLQSKIKKREDYIKNPPRMASKSDIEDMQAKVDDLKSELSALTSAGEKTSPLSRGEEGSKEGGRPPLSSFDQ